jgi:hypothetical protein
MVRSAFAAAASPLLLLLLAGGARAWTPTLECVPTAATRRSVTLKFGTTAKKGAPQHMLQFASQYMYDKHGFDKSCQVGACISFVAPVVDSRACCAAMSCCTLQYTGQPSPAQFHPRFSNPTMHGTRHMVLHQSHLLV